MEREKERLPVPFYLFKQAIEYLEGAGHELEVLAANSHLPQDARYIVVETDGSYRVVSTQQFRFNSKYCVFDYFSCLISINKSVDPKKQILSNNYLTFFTKNPQLPPEIIEKYYERTKLPDDRLWQKEWVCKHLAGLFQGLKPGNLVKIFFKAEAGLYRKLGRDYFMDKVLSNKVVINGETKGSPPLVNMNTKKKYSYRNIGPLPHPVLYTAEEAYKVKCFVDILKNCYARKKELLYVTTDGELVPDTKRWKEARGTEGPGQWVIEVDRKHIHGVLFVYRYNNRGELVVLDMEPIYT